MKKREFSLKLAGEDYNGDFQKVFCTDYDDDYGLVRFKDTLYDIRTGLWVVRLNMITKGYDTWKNAGCTPLPDLKQNDMLFYVKNNLLFMKAVEKAREGALKHNVPTQNEIELNLFTI